MIRARGSSWDGASDGTSDVLADVAHLTIADYSANGAIAEKNALVTISKSADVAAMTLTAPTDGTDDGKVLTVISKTAKAHIITCASVGFNAKGSSGTVTFGGAVGDTAVFVAVGGNWYVKDKINVTIA